MTISFIITTYNAKPYILQCLENLHPCLRPGDQVILVDNGSSDGTDDVVLDFIEKTGLGDGVRWTPIWLGTYTTGGIGIPVNIGLDHVECDTVFFVDGNDFLIPDAFLKARRDYEARPADIFFTDYLELDQITGQTQHPADAAKWGRLPDRMTTPATRLAAIDLIAVPWRKFYRAAFLLRHRIRYPEGAFFFEDNPFHWRVCTLADTIGFSRRIVCHHRVNLVDQIMASTDVEFAAVFIHFRTISDALPEGRRDLRCQAVRWLLDNISWHIARLQQPASFLYMSKGQEALAQISDDDWAILVLENATSLTWHYANRLRQGDIWGVIDALQASADRAVLTLIQRDIQDLGSQVRHLERQVTTSLEILQAQRAIDEFTALQATIDAVAPSS